MNDLIMIVEDDPYISHFLQMSFEQEGYRILMTTKGHEALSLFYSHQPDIVILDLGLPDIDSRKVLIDQEEIHLTPIEFNLLKLLIEHRGKVLTHNYIQKEIWGYQDHSNQNALRVFMATLRRKIEKDTNHPRFIVTEVGVGYYFKD